MKALEKEERTQETRSMRVAVQQVVGEGSPREEKQVCKVRGHRAEPLHAEGFHLNQKLGH